MQEQRSECVRVKQELRSVGDGNLARRTVIEQGKVRQNVAPDQHLYALSGELSTKMPGTDAPVSISVRPAIGCGSG